MEGLEQVGDARRVGQNQRQGTGIPSGQPPLDRTEPLQLGHQDCPVRVIGALEPEVLAPVEQDIGRRIVVQDLPQAVELLGMLLIKVDCLEVEPIQQLESGQAVGPIDRHRRLAKPLGNPSHQVTLRLGAV
jgi:hypothetical protein